MPVVGMISERLTTRRENPLPIPSDKRGRLVLFVKCHDARYDFGLPKYGTTLAGWLTVADVAKQLRSVRFDWPREKVAFMVDHPYGQVCDGDEWIQCIDMRERLQRSGYTTNKYREAIDQDKLACAYLELLEHGSTIYEYTGCCVGDMKYPERNGGIVPAGWKLNETQTRARIQHNHEAAYRVGAIPMYDSAGDADEGSWFGGIVKYSVSPCGQAGVEHAPAKVNAWQSFSPSLSIIDHSVPVGDDWLRPDYLPVSRLNAEMIVQDNAADTGGIIDGDLTSLAPSLALRDKFGASVCINAYDAMHIRYDDWERSGSTTAV